MEEKEKECVVFFQNDIPAAGPHEKERVKRVYEARAGAKRRRRRGCGRSTRRDER